MRVSLVTFEKPAFFWAGIVFLRSILDVSYVLLVNPNFEYSGFGLELNILKYIESMLMLFFFGCITPQLLQKPSDYLLFTFYFGFILPIGSYYSLNDQSRLDFYLILMCCVLVYLFSKGRRFKVPSVRHGQVLAGLLCLLFGSLTTFWLISTSGLRYFNLDFNLVYDYRRLIGETSYVGFMAYAIPWTTNVIGPASLGYALYRRQYWMVLIIFGLHVVWFGFSSHKSVLFYPFLIVTLWGWFQRTRAFSPVTIGVSFILLLSLADYLIRGNIFYGSLLTRRVFFVVAKNTFDYFEFFTVNSKVFWSNSFLSWFLDYPYHITPARLIGESRGTESHVNNSFVSTGYMHAGVYGLIFYGVVAGILFRIIDSLSKNYIQTLLVLSAILVPSRALLLSADLPTSLLTHGIGLALIIGLLMCGSLPAKNQ